MIIQSRKYPDTTHDVSLATWNDMKKNGLDPDNLAWLVPHQANMRIIEAVARRMSIPKEKVMINIEKYGNTTAASIPIALHEALNKGLLRAGQHVLMASFGSGFTWASAIVRW